MKIVPKSDPKGDHFFDIFLDRLLKRFGANLAPKTFPKWSQIGSKINASWGVDLTLVLERILAPFLLILTSTFQGEVAKIYKKRRNYHQIYLFFDTEVVVLLG